jgi:RNA polymerase sigma-70 factor (ECF subfamily)
MEARYDAELMLRGAVAPTRLPDRAETRRQDAECIDRVLAGDADAYRPLVERYQRSVFLLARRLLHNDTTEAEDLTQDALVRAYQYLGSLSDRTRFGPWLFQIARSLCRDRLRRKDIERRAIEHRLEKLRFESVPSGNCLGSSLSQLPPREFQVLHLRYFEGRSYDEIAEIMELTFGRVDHLIRRARGNLAAALHRERQSERAR